METQARNCLPVHYDVSVGCVNQTEVMAKEDAWEHHVLMGSVAESRKVYSVSAHSSAVADSTWSTTTLSLGLQGFCSSYNECLAFAVGKTTLQRFSKYLPQQCKVTQSKV